MGVGVILKWLLIRAELFLRAVLLLMGKLQVWRELRTSGDASSGIGVETLEPWPPNSCVSPTLEAESLAVTDSQGDSSAVK